MLAGPSAVGVAVSERLAELTMRPDIPFIAPTTEAGPRSAELLAAYHSWLFFEFRYLHAELYPENTGVFVRPNNPGGMYHWVAYGDPAKPGPSSRAAIVLATVGCDWQKLEDGR